MKSHFISFLLRKGLKRSPGKVSSFSFKCSMASRFPRTWTGDTVITWSPGVKSVRFWIYQPYPQEAIYAIREPDLPEKEIQGPHIIQRSYFLLVASSSTPPGYHCSLAITTHSLQDSFRNGFFDCAPGTLRHLQNWHLPETLHFSQHLEANFLLTPLNSTRILLLLL